MASITERAIKKIAGVEPFPEPPVIPVHFPVVMMHGFGILASLRNVGGHLHEQAMLLRRHGVRAYAPNVAAYDRTPVRAEVWKRRFQHILSETRAEKLNLIAHSMGGLDARYLISSLGLHERVASLTTVATPHHGTSIATYLMEQPQRLREWICQLADWAGSKTLEDATSDFARAVSELTPKHITEDFNSANPNHPSVKYWSYAGRAGKGTDVPMNPLLWPLNNVLYDREGENDGYVSVDSARWGTFIKTIDGDHLTQIGLPEGGGPVEVANELYLSIARRLAEEEL